jgi:hypothetical protein
LYENSTDFASIALGIERVPICCEMQRISINTKEVNFVAQKHGGGF